MITVEDCVALCGLDRDEIAAVAEHEHMPEVAATALASYLVHSAGGAKAIRQMIVDDLRAALAAGRLEHGAELLMALRHFITHHPEARAAA